MTPAQLAQEDSANTGPGAKDSKDFEDFDGSGTMHGSGSVPSVQFQSPNTSLHADLLPTEYGRRIHPHWQVH